MQEGGNAMFEACFCGIDDYEPAQFFVEVSRKAAKGHVCCECQGPIVKGDTYVVTTAKWVDSVVRLKTCRVCAAIRKDTCAPYEGLWESLEMAHEGDTGWLR